jgi:hypothetical protein
VIVSAQSHLSDEVDDAAGMRSLNLLWWIPASPVVGFVAAELLLDETWPLWQVIPLAILLASPFAVGAFYGLQAVRHGNRRGWVGLLLHVAFALLAVVVPISESLTV